MPAPEIAVAYVSIVPSLQGFQPQLRRELVGPTEDAGTQAGEGFAAGFKAVAVAGLAAIGAVAAKGLVEAIDRANIQSTLQGQLGATPKDAAKYGQAAGKLYSKGIVANFQEGADTVRAVMRGGLAPPGATVKQIASIGAKMSDVSKTFGTDMSMQTQAVSAMLKNNVAGSADEALDTITAGFQRLGPNAEDLLETFQEYSVQFSKLGLDSKMSLGLFSQGLKAGARDTDIIADAMKEFSILSVDMSEKSQDSYKALGLSASGMSAQIAKGGAGATKGLDTVLERLRAMKDPVAQEAAAVGLFGTQAEDLGDALWALDPSKAAAGMSKVKGAASDLGKTLHSGPTHEFTVMARALQDKLINTMTKYGIPAVMGLAKGIMKIDDAAKSAWTWVKEYGPYFIPFAIAVGGLTLALNANAIATWLMVGAMNAARVAIAIGTAVTGGMSAAMGLLNAIMALNPFVLIGIAVLALVAGFIVLWNKVEGFRNFWKSVWAGIQTAASFAWNSIIKPAFDGMMAGLKAIGDAAMWLWNNAIKPAFDFISMAARIWATFMTIVVFGPIFLVVRALGQVFMLLWEYAIKPTFDLTMAGAALLWAALEPIFFAMQQGLRAVANAALWVYNEGIKPMVSGILSGLKLAWNGAKAVFGLFTAGLRALGGVFMWLWNNGAKPAWSGIKTAISVGWKSGIKPIFDALKTGVGLIGKAFDKARGAIKVAWDKVKGIAKAPVQFIVDTVYNRGIVGVWNKVAKAFGAPQLDKFKFAKGGILPGYTPGRDPHKFYSPTGGALEMSGGESIMRPEFTRGAGAGFVNTFNKIARTRGVSGVRNALAGTFGGNATEPGTRRFADGGIFDWVGDTLSGAGSAVWSGVKKGAGWLKDSIESSARAGVKHVVNPLLAKFPGADTGFGSMIRKVPDKLLDTLFGYSKKADEKSTGGPGIKAALAWARTQAGKPYQWAGAGNPSWDCSGFMSGIQKRIEGKNPNGRLWSTFAFNGNNAPAGWVKNLKSPFQIGITNAGVGHTAGTLGGVNVESRGGDGVLVGSRARGANSMLFNSVYGYAPAKKYDNGGWLMPGATATQNATGRPEPVLTDGQWSAVSTLAAAGGGGLQDGDRLVLVTGEGSFEAIVDKRADRRIQTTLVDPATLGRTL